MRLRHRHCVGAPLQAIAELMGVPHEDRHKLFDWSNRMIGIDDPEFEGDSESGRRGRRPSSTCTPTASPPRSEATREDIISKLLGSEIDGDALSETEFDMFFMLLAVAGNETTRNATSHGMQALLDNPDQFAKLKVANPDLLPGAIEEILRWATPVLHFRRTAMEDYELGGKQIKTGRQGRHLAHLGQPRRGRVRRSLPLRHRALAERPHRLRRRRAALLPGCEPGPHGAAT